jgi:hypothetical protein
MRDTANQPVIVIREAGPDDAPALARLAALDSAEALEGPEVLVAEVAGKPWAALSLPDGRAVADPFRPSGDLLALLRVRAEHRVAERLVGRWGRVRRAPWPRPVPRSAEGVPPGRADGAAARG